MDENKLNENNVPVSEDKPKKKCGFWGTLLRIVLIILAVIAIGLVVITIVRSNSEIVDELANIDGVTKVERITQKVPVFDEKYLVTFEQPIDWDDPSKGTFEQRVEIGYQGRDRVNVFHASGYCLNDVFIGSDTAFKIDDRKELNKMYDGNLISMEYRFFGESVPKGLSRDDTDMWEYLTVENAAKDFYSIMEKLSPVLYGKKVFTGESKGGYTTNTMAYFYPDYCDAYVSYVAPLCEGIEDPRIEKNLFETIGDNGYSREEAADMRRIMLNFGVDCIVHRDELEDLYYQEAQDTGCVYRDAVTKETLFDMAVLEFFGGYWQYGSDIAKLQEILDMPDTTDKEHADRLDAELELLVQIAPPSTWSNSYAAFPYYVQVMKEMGGYYYDFSYLREAVIEATGEDMLAITPDMEKGILLNFMFTDEQKEAFVYDDTMRQNLLSDSETTKAHLIRVYGGCDTWYPARIHDTENPNVHNYVVQAGCHTANIGQLPEEEKAECQALLDSWLK